MTSKTLRSSALALLATLALGGPALAQPVTPAPLPTATAGSAPADPCTDATPFPGRIAEFVQVQAPRGPLRLVAVADEARRERGLMCVTTLADGWGMLFAFAGGDAPRSFWMQNTRIPLDMIFVAADGHVTSIAANVPATAPGTPDERIARRAGIGRYVIELAAGGAERAGLRRGTRLHIREISAR